MYAYSVITYSHKGNQVTAPRMEAVVSILRSQLNEDDDHHPGLPPLPGRSTPQESQRDQSEHVFQ